MRSVNAPAAPFVLPLPHRISRRAALSGLHAAGGSGGYVIEVAEPNLHRNEALRRAIGLAVLPLLFFLPSSWFLVRWVVHRSMRALIRLQQEIGQRDGSNLTSIPDLSLPMELVPIQIAVNRLLDRLERALAKNASSQPTARTSCARPSPRCWRSCRFCRPSSAIHRRQSGARVVGQVKALGNLAEKLLQLLAHRRGLALKREPTDVMPVLQVLIDDFRRQDGVGERLSLRPRGHAPFMVLADLDVFGIALRNLLENAVRYGSPDEPIEVSLEDDYRMLVSQQGRHRTSGY